MPVPDGYKDCSRCDGMLPLSNFHKCSRNQDGLRSTCKDCDAEISRAKERSLWGEVRELLGGKCERCGFFQEQDALFPVEKELLRLHGRQRAEWISKANQVQYSWVKTLRNVRKVPLAFRLMCMNCIAVERRKESDEGGRRVPGWR